MNKNAPSMKHNKPNESFKLVLVSSMSVVLGSCCLTGPKGEIDSPAKAFLEYGLRSQTEAYLVCIYQVKAAGEGNWADIQATVTDSIKGSKKRGDKFNFRRISDSGLWDFAQLQGELYYVFLRKLEGRMSVDVQDPNALWKYSDDLRRIVEKYRKEG